MSMAFFELLSASAQAGLVSLAFVGGSGPQFIRIQNVSLLVKFVTRVLKPSCFDSILATSLDIV